MPGPPWAVLTGPTGIGPKANKEMAGALMNERGRGTFSSGKALPETKRAHEVGCQEGEVERDL